MRSRSRLRWGRFLAALAGATVAAYLVYLGGANWFLGSSFADRVLNDKPERLRLEWSRARTWWPGSVLLDDVTIDGADRRFEWHARLDQVWVHLSLWGLPRKVFRTQEIAGQGLVFRLRGRDDAAPSGGNARPASAVPAAAAPAPPGSAPTAAPPAAGPAAVELAGRRDERRRPRQPWLLDLQGIRISRLREITIGQVSLLGDGELDGGLEHEIRGHLRLDELALSFARARLLESDRPVAEDVTLSVVLSSPAFEPGEDTLREIVGGASGDVTLTADVESVAALNLLLRKPDWLSFAGRGRLDTGFSVRDGEVQPGGHLDFAASALEARVLDWTAVGAGTIAVRLPESGSPAAELAVSFDEFAIRRAARAVAHVRGEGLEVAIAARAIDLEHGFEDLDLRVDVPPSRVDFVAYNDYLPQGSMRIEGGHGTIRSWFEYTERERAGRGEVAIEVAGAAGRFGELGLDGDLKLVTSIQGGDFGARSFDVSGSSVELSNVRVRGMDGGIESEGWWATLATGRARLDLREALGAEVVLHGRLRDAKPILTALASRNKSLFWLDELFAVRDVAGRTLLVLDGQEVSARDLTITGDRLEVQGDLGYAGGEREGLLYLKYGPFAAALEITGGAREWKLLHPWRWFDGKRRERERRGAS